MADIIDFYKFLFYKLFHNVIAVNKVCDLNMCRNIKYNF